MKKILFVINTLGRGGAETALMGMLERMNRPDRELCLYVLTDRGELFERVPSYVKILNTSYTPESVLNKRGKRRLVLDIIKKAVLTGRLFLFAPYLLYHLTVMLVRGNLHIEKLAWQMVASMGMKSSEEYDLAIAFLEGGSAYYVSKYIRAAKKAAFIHIDYQRSGYYRALDQDAYLGFDRIFAVSGEVRQEFLKAYPECEGITDIYENILDLERITELSHRDEGFGDGFEGTKLLSIGRLTSQKNFPLCLETAELLKERGRSFRWYIIGEGKDRKKLERAIGLRRLTDDVILMGDRENPYPYMKECDIYVQPSSYEGKSIAVEEARILGCPVILTNTSGNREQIVNGVDGLLCEAAAAELAKAIERLMDEPELGRQLGQRAREGRLAQQGARERPDLLEEEVWKARAREEH